MPQTHYSIGGSMARYSVTGRMSVHEIVGRPDGNDFVPKHVEVSGSIEGIGLTNADPLLDGTGFVTGFGSMAASGTLGIAAGTGQVIGLGNPEAQGSKRTTGNAPLIGIGNPDADINAIDGKSVIIQGVGSPQASGRSARTQTGNSVGTGSLTGAGSGKLTLLEMIEAEALESGLVLCLDAADADSYSGSGQTWTDVSGQGNHFYRGANSSSASDDPTFNGTAGALTSSEYFSLDGGDYFQETANHTFAESWHKNNAAFTLAAVIAPPDSVNAVILFNNMTSNIGRARGCRILYATFSKAIQLIVGKTGEIIFSGFAAATATIPAGAPLFLALAVDESVGTNGMTVQINNERFKVNCTYASPETGNSTDSYRLDADAGVVNKSASGSRRYVTCAWDGVRLSDSALDALYARLKARYTSLP